jgi:hypothetical protein
LSEEEIISEEQSDEDEEDDHNNENNNDNLNDLDLGKIKLRKLRHVPIVCSIKIDPYNSSDDDV